MAQLRRHILSEYIYSNEKDANMKTSGNRSTYDEVLKSPTYLTHSDLENSDPDEFFVCSSTLETRKIETSDPDYFVKPTKLTYTLEESDVDEFLC